MIVIPIKTCTDESENDERNTEDIESPMEWSLIELNGELLPPKQIPLYDPTNDHPATPPPNVELGSLYFDSKGTPTMIIGSHELKGNIQTLAHPLVLLRQGSKLEDDEMGNNKRELSYVIAGVVKKKILFNSYPKIIMR